MDSDAHRFILHRTFPQLPARFTFFPDFSATMDYYIGFLCQMPQRFANLIRYTRKMQFAPGAYFALYRMDSAIEQSGRLPYN